jgi:hypothetical protein
VLAFGNQVRGFEPGRSRRIFQGEKFSARLRRRGSKAVLSHVATLDENSRPFLAQVVPPLAARVSGDGVT